MNKNTNPIKLLIVDDEEEFRDSLSKTLSRRGYIIVLAGNGQEALNMVQREKPDLVILDQKMPGMDGIETLKQIRSINSNLPVIMLTGHADYETAIAGLHLDIVDFMHKPVDIEQLSSHINAILSRGGKLPLKERTIEDLMVPESQYPKIYVDQPVVELVDKLQKSFFEKGTKNLKCDRLRSILVYDRKNKFLGIIRFMDLLKLVLPPFMENSPYSTYFTGMFLAQCKVIGKRSIHEIMGEQVHININAPLMEAIHLMVEHHLINIPVMKNNNLAGILRERDIIYAIANNMGLV